MPQHPDHNIRIFKKQGQFVTSSPDLRHLPDSEMPEIAFAGRSNCGKSSLLNAVMGVKNLARTSNTPGRTKFLNFFSIADAIMLVDLPGYGFARASKSDRIQWQKNWDGYIQRRIALLHVFLLIDARRGLMPIDQEIMTGLNASATSFSIVLTKADKLPQELVTKTENAVREALKNHPAAWREPLVCSAKKKRGIVELQNEVLIYAGWSKRPELDGENTDSIHSEENPS